MESIKQGDYTYENIFIDHFKQLLNKLCMTHKRFGKTLVIDWAQ
jgi:hypothetical protein